MNFRQFLYISILVFIVLFGVSRCSSEIFLPYLSKETISESRLLYQKTQEERVRNNIDSILRKLLGKGTYDVSVVMSFREDYVQQDVVKRDPQNASETTSEEASKEFQRMRAEAMDDRPVADLSRVVSTQHTKLPGMIDLDSKRVVSDPLPGFPVLPESTEKPADPLPEKPSLGEIAQPNTQDDYNPDQKDTNSYKKKVEQSRVYYNETVTHTTRPGNRVEKMFVNVVVDSDQMKLLDLSKQDLEKLISDVASIDPARGDELTISFLPFIEKTFGIHQFYAKNRKILTFFSHVLDKLRWVIAGAIGLAILGGIGFLIYWMTRKRIARRNRELEEEKQRRFEEEKAREKEKVDAIDLKRKAVVNLTQSKPDDIATLILNWIEAFEGEEGKKNVPGS